MATKTVPVNTYRDGELIESNEVTYTTSPEQDNDETIRTAVANALAANRAFITNPSPTAAQIAAQVKSLSRQMNGLIRLVNSQLDAAD